MSKTPTIEQLQAQIAKLEAESERNNARILEAELKSAMSSAGIPVHLHRPCSAWLASEGLTKIDDDGQPVFLRNGVLPTDLNDGLASWLTTEDAEMFRPPSGPRQRPTKAPRTQSGELDWDRLAENFNPLEALRLGSEAG